MQGTTNAASNASGSSAAARKPLYLQPTMLVLMALGYSGGVPLEMTGSLMPAWASKAGWSVIDVGRLSLGRLPYSFKVLWAPFTDHCGIPGLRWLGRRRAWLLLTQFACLATLGVLAWQMDGRGGAIAPNAMLMLVGVLVFAGATQDIVGDAFRAECLQPQEFGAGASVFVTGARLAGVVGGAGALIIASRLGGNAEWSPWAWTVAIGLLALSTVAGMIGTLLAKEPPRPEGVAHGFKGSVTQPFTIFWERWGPRLPVLFLFTMIYRLPENLASAMTPPLLVQGLGYDLESIGWVKQALGAGMSIVGTMLGGWWIARWGILRCLWVFALLGALSNTGLLLLAQAYHATVATKAAAGTAPVGALIPVIAIENIGGGLVTCAFVAYMMSACDRRATATQYALLTSFMAIGHSLTGWLSGWMVATLDYRPFFMLSIAAVLVAIAPVPFLLHTPGSEGGDGTPA